MIKLLNYFKKNNKNETDIVKTINYLKTKNFSKLNNIYKSEYSFIKINTLYKNIITYTKQVDKILNIIKADEAIYMSNLPTIINEIYLDSFYLDDKNYYLDISITTEKFVDSCINFLVYYNELEKGLNLTFNQHKNLTVTQHIVVNIIYIFKEIESNVR
jgi:hypothetical protein